MLKTALRNVLAHKARLLMTVLAVGLGVAFVSGTLVFADSTAAAHRAAASKNFADIAVTVTANESPTGGPADQRDGVLDDALVRRLAAVPGVAAVRPTADGRAVLNAADGTPLRVRTGANLAAAYVPGADGEDRRHPDRGPRPGRRRGDRAGRRHRRRRPPPHRRPGHAGHRRPGHDQAARRHRHHRGHPRHRRRHPRPVREGHRPAAVRHAGPLHRHRPVRRARHRPVRALPTRHRRSARRPGRGHHRFRPGRPAGRLRRHPDPRLRQDADGLRRGRAVHRLLPHHQHLHHAGHPAHP
ncbi:ABC transporter permease [Kitasatospora aburaviensis]